MPGQGFAVQSSAGRPPVRTRWRSTLSAAARLARAWSSRSGRDVAVQEVAELGAGESVAGVAQRGVDVLGERVAGVRLERPGGGAGGVVLERERGVEVFGRDRGGAVEERVDEREADDVRFGAGGELSGEAGLRFGELLVGVGARGCGRAS